MPPPKPDSLLTAAHRLADAARMSWAKVQPIYRALQEDEDSERTAWLPKSSGRTIWAAHPHFIARLMVGVAAAEGADDAHNAVEIALRMKLDTRLHNVTEWSEHNFGSPLEHVLSVYLSSSPMACELHSIVFAFDEGRVTLELNDGRVDNFIDPLFATTVAPALQGGRGIYRRGVIMGFVFERLAESVNWRMDRAPTFGGGGEASDIASCVSIR